MIRKFGVYSDSGWFDPYVVSPNTEVPTWGMTFDQLDDARHKLSRRNLVLVRIADAWHVREAC